ncbi:hypothetical protein FWF48_01525 [Candidatus Saccharibacteria bacterium]|nr:hypothetical protein [Candidatus Saccharibacteria bacterium]
MSLSLPIVRLFNKPVADRIWQSLKKAWYCVARRATLRKCDSNFKDDVKHSLLKKVIIKHPKMVKPLSTAIEVTSVLIVIITIWSLLVVVRSGLSLYVYGTCDIAAPSSCSLNTAEACSIDEARPTFWQSPIASIGYWFSDFGEVIAGLPNRIKHWDANDYLPNNPTFYAKYDKSKPMALEILDPGCIICQRSYLSYKRSHFINTHNLTYIAYPIKSESGFKFKNSYLIVTYLQAIRDAKLQNNGRATDWQILDKIFIDKNAQNIPYQTAFNNSYSATQAETILQNWLKDFGFSSDQVNIITIATKSQKVKDELAANRNIVDNKIRAKRIPTFIYDGHKQEGLFKGE